MTKYFALPTRHLFLLATIVVGTNLSPAGAQTWDTVSTGLNGNVFGMITDTATNKLYACGNFQFSGATPVSRVASWDGNALAALNNGLDLVTYAFGIYNNELYAGGTFNYSGSNPLDYIARWDGLDWFPVGGGTNNEVYYLSDYAGELYAAGAFDSAGGVFAPRIARWNGTVWDSLGAGIGGPGSAVYSMAEYNGDLYVAGIFTTAGGVPVNNIARWDGTAWYDVGGGATGGGGYINDLYAYNGELYATGNFTSIGGVISSGIGKWNGTIWQWPGAGVAGNLGYGAVLFAYQGDLYAGGNFASIDGVTAENIARFDGSSWNALGSGCNSEVDALEVYDNQLYVGGDFTVAGGLAAQHIARWTMPCTASVAAAAADESCSGLCDGSVNANATGIAPIAYLWSTGATTASVASLCAGTYIVTITDSAGCMAVDSAVVSANPLPVVSVSFTDATCNNLCDGTGIASATGLAPFSYSWNTTPVQLSDTATMLCAGSYIVTVTDSAGCVSVDSVTIGDPAYTLGITSQNASCPLTCDGSATATFSSPHGPLTYSWNTVPVQTAQTATALCSGTWLVTVTDTNNCALTDSVTITEPVYTLSFSVTAPTCDQVCDGTATVSSSSVHSPFSYYWYTTPQQTTDTASGLCAGYVTVTVTDTNNCAVTDSVMLSSPPPFSTGLAAVGESCPGSCDGLAFSVPASAYPPFQYFWSTVPQQTTDTASNLCAGMYSVTVIDSLGCFSTDSIEVPASLVLSFTIQQITCSGGPCDGGASVSLNGIPPYTYVWSTGDSTASVSNLCSGNYTVDVTDSTGCVVSGQVNIPPPLYPSVQFATVPLVCAAICDAQATAIALGNGPFTYAWSTSDTSATIDSLCTGWYYVTVTDVNGCSTLDSVLLDPAVPINFNVVSVSHVTCFGACDGIITTTTSGGTPPYAYVWNNGLIVASPSSLCADTFTVAITDSNGCVYNSAPVVVTEPAELLLTMTPSPATCAGCNDGSVATNVTGGTLPYAYFWTPPVLDPNQLTTGWYYLCITDANGCQVCDSAFVDELTGISQHAVPLGLAGISPNPFSEYTLVSLPRALHGKTVSVQIHDLRGRRAVNYNALSPEGELRIEKGTLNPGMYLLTVTSEQGEKAHGKLLVE